MRRGTSSAPLTAFSANRLLQHPLDARAVIAGLAQRLLGNGAPLSRVAREFALDIGSDLARGGSDFALGFDPFIADFGQPILPQMLAVLRPPDDHLAGAQLAVGQN